jgi:DNA-binding IclR family transcriptional regulator
VLSGRTRRVGVVDLAGELGLPKGTVHGLLRTLQHVGFIEQDRESGKYQLGAALLHMGSSYLDGNELRPRALNSSDALAARTHEAVRIGTLHDSQVLIVHHVLRPDDSLQTLDVGSLLPAHATALGKVLLANRPYNQRQSIRSGGVGRSPHRPVIRPAKRRCGRSHGRARREIGQQSADGEAFAPTLSCSRRQTLAARAS